MFLHIRYSLLHLVYQPRCARVAQQRAVVLGDLLHHKLGRRDFQPAVYVGIAGAQVKGLGQNAVVHGGSSLGSQQCALNFRRHALQAAGRKGAL